MRRTFFYLSAGFFFFPLLAWGAVFRAGGEVSVPPGVPFVVDVSVDTEGESINAFEGSLIFPKELFAVESVRDGGSLVNIWVQKPTAKEGKITFSGITPGGFRGKEGLLFRVHFTSLQEGKGEFAFEGGIGYSNTLEAAPITIHGNPLRVLVHAGLPSPSEEKSDTTAPEAFTPRLLQDPNSYEGKNVLLFFTQDKQSGVERYEICEGMFGTCKEGESPYVLSNQKANGIITVKAFDFSGNERIEKLSTPEAKIRYALVLLLAILLSASAAIIIYRKGAPLR